MTRSRATFFDQEVAVDPLTFMLGFLAGIVSLVVLYLVLMIFHPWVKLKTGGGRGTLPYIFYMRLRGTPVALVVDAYISMIQSSALVSLREVESHYIANRARIAIANDLVESMNQGPIKTHIAVWLTSEDAGWLGEHLSEHASQIYGDDSNPAQAPNADQLEVERCDRIARRANAAVVKAQKVSGRH